MGNVARENIKLLLEKEENYKETLNGAYCWVNASVICWQYQQTFNLPD
jgi:hypothetical protein